MTAGLVQVGRRQLKLTNLGKVLYPEVGFTKGEVVDYYRRVAPVILPHLKDRPLTLKRYPEGVGEGYFYEKRCPAHRPGWVRTARVWSGRNGEWVDYCVVNDLATLVWVANLASIELHVLLSRARAVGRPTAMVFDLDPGPMVGMLECAAVAVRMRELLRGVGLTSFVKTSGGKGLHVYVPLNEGRVTFEGTKRVARELAMTLERDDPKGVTSVMRRDVRAGRVFIDWSQNDGHKTTACVYTLRALERPTVSMPVTWEEVEGVRTARQARRLMFGAEEALKRVEEEGDLFEPVLRMRQKLPTGA